MTPFPNSPLLIKAGLVLVEPAGSAVRRVIALQYNPDTLTRSLQVQAVGGEGGGDRSEAMRLKGPPVETLKLEAEIDAADQLEVPKENKHTVESGIQPQLSALEVIVYPPSARLAANNRLAGMGTLEIAPVESPLVLFVWGHSRVVPVRLTEFSITEEAFDSRLNPIRAKVSLGMRVLNVNDVGFDHRGGGLFMAYLREKERLATLGPKGSFDTLGITGV